MSAALEVRGISKRFGAHHAVRSASLSVAAGEVVAVLGASGAGKSTLFRCITRLTEPDDGEVWVGGRRISGLKGRALAQVRRDIGVVFQQFNLVRRRSALENVLFGRLGHIPAWRVALRAYAADDVREAEAALASVGLKAHASQRADTLSGGQQQRVAFARALAQESRVLIADEPVASLDPVTAVTVMELVRELAKARGLAVLCALHQVELAERFADRILVMNGGLLSPAAGGAAA